MDVLALDIIMGKRFVVVYHNEICLLEAEIMHTQTGFAQLKNLFESCETVPQVVFEAMESFQNSGIDYTLLDPLEARKQTDGLRIHKTDISDVHKIV